MMNTYKPLRPEEHIIIGSEGEYEYSASILYDRTTVAPDDTVRQRGIYVSGDNGYTLAIAYRFMRTNRIYVRVFMPTKQGTPRVRSKDRRHHTIGGFFNEGTSDDVLLAFVRKVAFGEGM